MWTFENKDMHLVKLPKYVMGKSQDTSNIQRFSTLTLCYGCDRRYEENY